jgi:hypothetical protein
MATAAIAALDVAVEAADRFLPHRCCIETRGESLERSLRERSRLSRSQAGVSRRDEEPRQERDCAQATETSEHSDHLLPRSSAHSPTRWSSNMTVHHLQTCCRFVVLVPRPVQVYAEFQEGRTRPKVPGPEHHVAPRRRRYPTPGPTTGRGPMPRPRAPPQPTSRRSRARPAGRSGAILGSCSVNLVSGRPVAKA